MGAKTASTIFTLTDWLDDRGIHGLEAVCLREDPELRGPVGLGVADLAVEPLGTVHRAEEVQCAVARAAAEALLVVIPRSTKVYG